MEKQSVFVISCPQKHTVTTIDLKIQISKEIASNIRFIKVIDKSLNWEIIA